MMITINQIVGEYLNAARGRGVKSVEDLDSVWKRIASRKIGDLPPDQLTPSSLNRFLENVLRGPAPSSALKLKRILSAAFRYAALHMEGAENLVQPCRVISLPRSKPRSVVLSEDDLGRLLDFVSLKNDCYKLDPYDVLIVAYLYTAARASELLNVRRSSVSVEGDHVRIQLDKTKNGDPHTLFVFGFGGWILKRYLEEDLQTGSPKGFIFGSPKNKGKPLSRQAAFLHWRSLQIDLGIKPPKGDFFSLHDLRRSAASTLANDGESLENIDLLLNHRTLNAVQATYYHIHEKRLAPIFERLANRLDDLFAEFKEARLKGLKSLNKSQEWIFQPMEAHFG